MNIKPPVKVLSDLQEQRVLLQDFLPLAKSLEWELGQLYWNQHGNRAFLSGEVPFAINNDGNLSRKAAEVFFQA